MMVSATNAVCLHDADGTEVDRAESELAAGTSPFHKARLSNNGGQSYTDAMVEQLGRAVILFLRATLGFEKEIMEQAAARLAEAEEAAAEHQRRAIRDPSTAYRSKIYPIGAEYALCHAESQLMSAVVAVLNESLTESLKGFYKLKKAFNTLYELNEAEKRYMESHGFGRKDAKSVVPAAATIPRGSLEKRGHTPGYSGKSTPDAHSSDDEDDAIFEDAQDHFEGLDMKSPSVSNGKPATFSAPRDLPSAANSHTPSDNEQDVDFNSVTNSTIDHFIHA